MSIIAIAISMMLYLGNEKVTPIEKEMLAIINSYHVWDVYESEHMGSFAMLKFRPYVEQRKEIINKAREYGKQ